MGTQATPSVAQVWVEETRPLLKKYVQGGAPEDRGLDPSELPYEGLVQYRKSLVEFDIAHKTIGSRIAELKKAIPQQAPGEEELADDLAEALAEINGEFSDAVNLAMSTAENVKNPITDAVRMTLQKYITEIRSNPFVKLADKNPFGVKIEIEKTLGDALQGIRENLPFKKKR